MATEYLSRTRSLAGKLGGLTLSATRDPREYTTRARAAFLRRFWPDDLSLDPHEAERRAKAALRLHMTGLAMRSAAARKRKGARR